MEEQKATAVNQIPCKDCGAFLKFKPGTTSLSCDYCGAANEIAPAAEATVSKGEQRELDLDMALRNFEQEANMEVAMVKCTSCAAESTLPPNVTSDSCPFCDTPLVLSQKQTKNIHKPQYVLPFQIDDKKASRQFSDWVKGLWWAPSNLNKYASHGKIDGMYMPYWTFDCETETQYSGERGTDYQEHYTDSEGKSQTRTKTRWSRVSGWVRNTFDDILVIASKSINRKKLAKLTPWDLNKLVPYGDEYLTGFKTEHYQIDLKHAFEDAKQQMKTQIKRSVESDIGGDRQRISRMDIQYYNTTFKHILLPIWISAYQYNDKVYQFMVNAQTGEVQGERPYSAWKIAAAVIAGLLVIAAIVYFNNK